MKRAVLRATLSVLALSWVGCGVDPPTRPIDATPSYALSDWAHGGSVPGFYWLPPMIAPPVTSGSFIGSLSPEVQICQWSGSACVESPWRFARTFGPAGHRVGVDVQGQHYHLNWDTKAFDLTLGVPYRVSVWLGGVQLGFADVQLEANGSGFKNLQSDVVGLVDGRLLPIKFRIEYGVLGQFSFDLAYHSGRDADLASCRYNADVFLYDRASSVSVNLTSSPSTMDGTPSWSPDGTKLAFASNRAHPGACGDPLSPPDVYVMDLVAGTVQRLTTGGGWKPAWSPDGLRIAFQRGWPPNCPVGDEESAVCRQHDIWVMDADGTNQTQLTDVGHAPGEDPYEDHDPVWNRNPVQPLSVTFARSGNAPYDLCPNPPPAPLNVCDFDVVSKGVSNPFEWNHTRIFDRDQNSPAWRRDGGGFVYAAPPPLNGVPGWDGSRHELWVRIYGAGPDLRLTISGPGEVNREADWAWNNGEILFTRYLTSGVGLWVLAVPNDPAGPWPAPSFLVPGAAWGRYRPPMAP